LGPTHETLNTQAIGSHREMEKGPTCKSLGPTSQVEMDKGPICKPSDPIGWVEMEKSSIGRKEIEKGVI